ncbi:MAG: TlpA disulfide reductase family protein [Gammaproteobacteria bacterium]
MDVGSQQHAVSEYLGKGKWTVVNIWGVDCPPCREEMPELVLLHDQYSATLLTILGIAIDFPGFGYADKDEVKNFMDEYMIDFPVLLSDESISKKLGAGYLQGLPTTYIFSPQGELVGMQTGGINRNIILDFIKKRSKITNSENKSKNSE